jgi:predicted nuclease of restriction endonuclease-like (RecB) superfamily
MSEQPTPGYPQDFAEVLGHIQQARQRVLAQANTALIDLYWRIGQTLSHKVVQAGWGKGVVSELARYIAQADPTIHGFSDKNLWRMKQFFETYQGDEQLSALAKVLPWTHNTTIFSRCKSPEERRFYLALCQQEKYTSRELERQIDAASFERATLSPPKLSAALRVLQPAVGEVFKDRYVLEFLGLPEPHSENDLKRALVQHMKAFVLELGKDFLFVGEEVRLQVGNQDFFIDLLFYHLKLRCYVVIELKAGPFKPEHLGQLGFYLTAVDAQGEGRAGRTHHRPAAVQEQEQGGGRVRAARQRPADGRGRIPADRGPAGRAADQPA